ncbi:glycoside hydrolase family 5 protein [Didymella exigua CBS 183.55]|uniref:glucan 1,3-beta-glucosidase n=1 Tax=Didymella exigua CBS 183.55 TaxID=1150837 RepID=A0A6A5R746_9PLEO|nr:glycoside hydrolase family 5 protein [Didymella exigua CBS 183.55]KAF1923008.1 glycoside hydrolase family 5 protein [Didymella exigua CBS 183.55]
MPTDSERDPSHRRPRGDERRRRRESHGETSGTDRPRRRRESNTPYEFEGRRRKGHRATDSQGELLRPTPRDSRYQSDSEWDSSAPRRRSRRPSTSDRKSAAPLSLDALAKLDKEVAKKNGGWRGYDYDEDYLKEVRRKEKQLEKDRVKTSKDEKKKAQKEEERRKVEESDREVLEEKERRRQRELRRKKRESREVKGGAVALGDLAGMESKRASRTEDERERRRRDEARYTASEIEERRERRQREKQKRKSRVVSGPLAEEGGIDDDDEHQYMMEKRGGAGSTPTVLSAAEQARKKKRKKIIIGVVSVLILLAIIIPIAVLMSNKKSNNTSGSDTAAGQSTPKNSNLDGKDPNSVPQADKGGILDPWSWYDTEDFNVTYTNELVGGLPIIGLNSTWNDDVQANSKVPNLQDSFEYGKTPIRGVNVGGWLNLEPFITPSFFENFGARDGVVDEYTLLTKLGPTKAKSTLEQHYSAFVNKQTFKEIRAAGIDHVRFPFGYWIVQTYDGDPYLAQVSWRYLLRGIEYCRQNGLRVNLDLHGAPGSQNGWNHSGRQGVIGWLNGTDGDLNAQRTLDVHHKLSVFFAQPRYKNVVTMYGLVNEPRNVELDTNRVVNWTQTAITQIRNDNISAVIVFGDGFMGLDNWQGKLQGNENLLLDVHQYVIFNVNQLSLGHRDKLNFACSAWTQQSLRSMDTTTGFGPTMCGEWSQADTDCTQYINNVNIGTRWEGTYDTGNLSTAILKPQCPVQGKCTCDPANADPSTYTADYKKWLYQFAIGQMDAFEAGWGWFYWTWETEKATQWSYRRGMAAGILPTTAYDRDWSCPDNGVDGLDTFTDLPEYY